MAEISIHLHIRITPKALLLGAAGVLLFAGAAELGSESFSLATSYPAPSGVYNTMITTGNTYLARDAQTNGGKVGIGTVTPGALLDVAGNLTTSAGGNITSGGGIALKANGTNSGPLQVVWDAASPAGYYAVYAP